MRRADWCADAEALRGLRTRVFIVEQNVPAHEEWDDRDADAVHLLAEDAEGQPIGVARVGAEGRLGRVAVLMAWRRRGVASALIARALEEARALGRAEVVLDAQTHALGLYARFGFEAEGDEFLDAGLAHRRMRLRLGPRPAAAAAAP